LDEKTNKGKIPQEEGITPKGKVYPSMKGAWDIRKAASKKRGQ